MRKLVLALSLFVPVVGLAQGTPEVPTYEQILNQTFANMNGRPDVKVTITGTERVGDIVVPFDTTLVWRRVGIGIDRTQKLSLVKHVNGEVTQEIRANGKTLYAYDFKTRSYSATAYHQIRDTRNADQRDEGYHMRMLSTLNRSVSSNGPDSYAARLVQEAMGDPAGQTVVLGVGTPLHYRSWMPGRSPVELLATIPPTTYRDPVVPERTRTGDVEYGYTPDEKNRYFMYNGSPRRSIVFQVYQPEADSPLSDYSLQRVFFGEGNSNGGRTRLTQWTMTISYPVVAPADVATYEAQFNPYTDMRGWRIVVGATAPKG